jgi:peptide/nickel transport system ATP-binding protein
VPSIDRPVLELENVSISYESNAGVVQAVRDVNLTVDADTIVGLVGESGCGKSTLAYAIMRLLKQNAKVTTGSIRVKGQDIYQLSAKELRRFRWNEMAMVFQSAMSALNPVMTIEEQILDVFRSHRPEMSRSEALAKAFQLLDLVRIARKHLNSYPHELSGGMKQRIVIAIAIALEPSLVIMDEPTTALDVVVQRSILDQIREIQKEQHFAILFISHDFSLVSELASRVAVMYAGRIVEVTDANALARIEGHHPYTQGLMRAIPRLTVEDVQVEGIPGSPPDLTDLPKGCSYQPRCPVALPMCRTTPPTMHFLEDISTECHLFADTAERRGI